jgi:hypothetical protein
VTAVFGMVGAIAFVWSAVRNHLVYRALIDSFPPELKDGLTAKFALHVIALSPSTPLSLQAEYLKSLAAGCVAMLCFSLSLFCADKIEGWLALGGCLLIAISAIRSWKTYRQNCNRAVAHNDGGES